MKTAHPISQDPRSLRSLSVRTLLGWAHQLYEAERYPASADLFRYILSRAPNALTAWYGLGRCHAALDDHATAASLFEIASDLGECASFLELAARAWLEAGNPERASMVMNAAWEASQ